MTVKALDRAVSKSRAFRATAMSRAVQMKNAGALDDALSSSGSFNVFGDSNVRRSQREGYNNFKGWLFSAINAIASEGAGQPVRIGRMSEEVDGTTRRSMFSSSKGHSDFLKSRMSKGAQQKASNTGIELINGGELYDLLNRPNGIQDRWQFVYSFICNLCLTGFSYVIKDVGEDGREEIYSVPTTWVTPDHTERPFGSFTLKNPAKPSVEGEPIPAENVAFAHLPNPSDPLSALAPASSQAIPIRIDGYIQTSQESFFNNGIFPSVIVTVGKVPMGGDGQGYRPRLSASQRRQVHGAIRKSMGSIANYGNPGIVDGLIERIDRLSATQNEMGWEKSEKAVRLRILSAFAVHPFILGEEMAGSYAQAYTVLERFCNRVNTYLDLLGVVLTNFFAQEVHGFGQDNIVWWEPCEPKDPEQVRRWWATGADKNWITQNEFRAFLGLPPDEDSNQQYMDRLMASEVVKLLTQLGQGNISESQALAFLQGIGLPNRIAGPLASLSGVTPVQQEMEELADEAHFLLSRLSKHLQPQGLING